MAGPSKSRPSMSHRKTNLGIPRLQESAKVVLVTETTRGAFFLVARGCPRSSYLYGLLGFELQEGITLDEAIRMVDLMNIAQNCGNGLRAAEREELCGRRWAMVLA
jgi:hypothetical protein